ncbi:MAG: barstar family protein [Actinomycetales bacterium]
MSTSASFEIAPAAGKDEVLAEFARSLAFPAHFGHNLDALADCLRDWADGSTAPRTLVWHVDPAFSGTRAHGLILDILSTVSAESRRASSPAGPLTVVVRPADPDPDTGD